MGRDLDRRISTKQRLPPDRLRGRSCPARSLEGRLQPKPWTSALAHITKPALRPSLQPAPSTAICPAGSVRPHLTTNWGQETASSVATNAR